MSDRPTGRTVPSRAVKVSNNERLCQNAARSLTNVLHHARANNQGEELLEDFGHSSNCRRINCTSYCKIFKLLREHTTEPSHYCSLLPICTLLNEAHIRVIVRRSLKRLNRKG